MLENDCDRPLISRLCNNCGCQVPDDVMNEIMEIGECIGYNGPTFGSMKGVNVTSGSKVVSCILLQCCV